MNMLKKVSSAIIQEIEDYYQTTDPAGAIKRNKDRMYKKLSQLKKINPQNNLSMSQINFKQMMSAIPQNIKPDKLTLDADNLLIITIFCLI